MQTQSLLLETTQPQVGEHREKQFVQLRQQQGRDTQPEGKGGVVTLSEEAHSKEAHKSFIQVGASGLCLPSGQLSGFFFHT